MINVLYLVTTAFLIQKPVIIKNRAFDTSTVNVYCISGKHYFDYEIYAEVILANSCNDVILIK